MACKLLYNPKVGGYVRRCSRKRRATKGLFGEIGDIGELGDSTSLRGTIASVKGVLVNGMVAAGGAVITDKVFMRIADEINKEKVRISGIPLDLIEIVTGLALGIVVGKALKKPQLGAMVAIGPVVVGTLKVIRDLMGGKSIVKGLGMMSVEPYRERISDMGAVTQIGGGVPAWMMNPSGEFAGLQGGY